MASGGEVHSLFEAVTISCCLSFSSSAFVRVKKYKDLVQLAERNISPVIDAFGARKKKLREVMQGQAKKKHAVAALSMLLRPCESVCSWV